MMEYCTGCILPNEVFPLMIASCLAGWIVGVISPKLGEIWKARRG